MSDSWDFYLCSIADKAASVSIRMGVLAPDPKRPHFVMVRTAMQHALPSGLSSDEESEALWALEEALTTKLENAGASKVGRVTHASQRTWMFYGPTEAGLEALAATVRDEFPAYRMQIAGGPDAEWGEYRNIYPSPIALRWMHDRKLCQDLEDGGDDGTQKRVVQHEACFGTPEERATFSAAVRTKGFGECRDLDRPGQPLRFVVTFSNESTTTLHELHPVTSMLVALAQRHRGQYTGWTCAPLTPPS